MHGCEKMKAGRTRLACLSFMAGSMLIQKLRLPLAGRIRSQGLRHGCKDSLFTITKFRVVVLLEYLLITYLQTIPTMQHISLHHFNRLSKRQQYGLLENHGTFLDVFRHEGDYKVALFDYNGYYVEVWLNQRTDELLKAVAFTSYNKLDAYIKGIDIKGIN
jgi:hypothetical protein